MNIIIATTELINVYLDKLVDSLSDNTVIFEFASRQIIYDRSYNINSYVYHNGLDQTIKLKNARSKLKALLDKNPGSEIFFNHPLDLLCNYASKQRHVKLNLIPDGLLNFVRPAQTKSINRKKLLNRKLKSLLAMTFFHAPAGNILGEDKIRYNKIYAFTDQGLYVPTGASICILDLDDKQSFDHSAVFLGQYTSTDKKSEYECFVLEVLKKEKPFFRQLCYRPHPSEAIIDSFKHSLKDIGVGLDDSSRVVEFNDAGYSTFIGIFSSPLIHMRVINNKFRCISYPKDFWGKSDSDVLTIVEKMKSFGCEVKAL